MRYLDLRDAADRARRDGWCTLSGTLEDVRAAGRRHGWAEISMRQGDPPVSTLRPTEIEDARPRSLSALYGRGAQPLHTDGAHLIRPPDLVVLCSQEANETPTKLSRAWRADGTRRRWPPNLDDGVFVVRGGRESFHTTARLGSGIRFDPGCMTPCDQRSRELTRYFAEALAGAEEYLWAATEQLLVIDNATALHARTAVKESDMERSLERVAFDTRSQS
jgi:hypothetical protein